MTKICSEESCHKPAYSRGMCAAHHSAFYRAAKKAGITFERKPAMPNEERLRRAREAAKAKRERLRKEHEKVDPTTRINEWLKKPWGAL